MSVRVFIDGAAGTTGLEIRERLQSRGELSLVALDDKRRKDSSARADALNEAELVILCLPDAAAREAVTLIVNPNVRVIDPSSAHRVTEGWVFGFPELEATRRVELRHAMRVSNPGCYSTGFLSIVRPLTRGGIVPPDWAVTCNAVSGYSGGGRSMILEFEDADAPHYSREIFRTYGLNLEHKHVEEMRVHAGLLHRPLFSPSVGRFHRGMLVEVPLQLWALPGNPSVASVHAALADSFTGEKLIEVASLSEAAAKSTLDAEELKNTNRLKLYVFGNEARRQARVVAVLDNLGKGAAGACVQNLNAMMGWPETAGLV
ncbi:MAG TPA: N-acetyl-gamma-glutamyl-phosphate reductase [Micropepsaceae bacterium]|jgi:N-acetyl-gamma-glutamyl-phosphate reductase|nr:N-acetyl-gamma-glutamyl-phosphate reductase [Micropepsaceae bacterium]